MKIKKHWNVLSDKSPQNKNEDMISYLLRLRNIKDKERFLNPSFRDLIPFEEFRNINTASEIVLNGIKNQSRFCVYFDVDVDGISAGAIQYKYLKNCGAENVSYMINTGKVHGISHRNLSEFDDIDILIIADSLDSNYAIYKKLADKGVQIVILDHHEFDCYPDDATLVSSAKNYTNPNLSGSGVVWKFCAYVDAMSGGNYSKSLLDLAACGILADVCDVSEASFENRFIVNCGLNNLKNQGLKTIIGNYSFNSQSVLWSIAPLVNAANRTGNNELAVELFLCDDDKQLKKILKQLKEIKIQQDLTVAESFELVEVQIKENCKPDSKVIYGFVSNDEYAGLIATKASNKYMKPCIIFHNPSDDTDELKGSIRGFGVKDFRKDINSTELARCDGHDNAAGITCKKSDLGELIEMINIMYKNIEFKLESNIDLRLRYRDITEGLVIELNKLNKLSGKGFKPITVCLTNVEVDNPTQMQDKHSKFNYCDLSMIKWNDMDLYKSITYNQNGYCSIIDVFGELQINKFRGEKSLQLIISDYDNAVAIPDFLRESIDN